MSWDVSIVAVPKAAQSIADIPLDFEGSDVGPRSVVIDVVTSLVPAASFDDPSWGVIETPEFVVEVNLGRDETVGSVGLRVRGGEAAVGLVVAVVDALGRRLADGLPEGLALRAVDVSRTEFLDPSAAAESLTAWRAFRARVVSEGPQPLA